MADDLLSLREAAARTGISASHLRLLARTGKVDAQRVGSYWVTTEAAVRAYLQLACLSGGSGQPQSPSNRGCRDYRANLLGDPKGPLACTGEGCENPCSVASFGRDFGLSDCACLDIFLGSLGIELELLT